MRKAAIVKTALAGMTALAIAGSTLVYAQQRDGRNDGPRRWQPNAEDMRAFGEARIAALKAGLALSADQEKNWAAYEQAVREFTKQRLDRRNAGAPPPAADPVERMRGRADAMATAASALKRLADATDPLYRSLDEGQKRRFALLAGRLMPRDGMQQPWQWRSQWRGQDGPGRDARPQWREQEGRGRGDGPRNFERFRRGGADRQPFEEEQRSPDRL
jgi:hypothetical protein